MLDVAVLFVRSSHFKKGIHNSNCAALSLEPDNETVKQLEDTIRAKILLGRTEYK